MRLLHEVFLRNILWIPFKFAPFIFSGITLGVRSYNPNNFFRKSLSDFFGRPSRDLFRNVSRNSIQNSHNNVSSIFNKNWKSSRNFFRDFFRISSFRYSLMHFLKSFSSKNNSKNNSIFPRIHEPFEAGGDLGKWHR